MSFQAPLFLLALALVPIAGAVYVFADRRRKADAARFARHSPGDRWYVDETYIKVNGGWHYVYRADDQHGQVIDVLLSARRRRSGPTVLHPGAPGAEGSAERGGHRRRTGLPRRAR